MEENKATETNVIETENTELVQLVNSSGIIEDSKKAVIIEAVGTFLKKAAEWKTIVSGIVITSPEEKGKIKMAREGRLALRGYRIEGANFVKSKRDELKILMNDFLLEDKTWLRVGQLMDKVFKELEAQFEEKENTAERLAEQKKANLKAVRIGKLEELGFTADDIPGVDLGTMDEPAFYFILGGMQKAKKDKEEEALKQQQAEQKKKELSIQRQNELTTAGVSIPMQLLATIGDLEEDDFNKLLTYEIEKKNAEKINAVRNERMTALSQYGIVNDIYTDLGTMLPEVYAELLKSKKDIYEKKQQRLQKILLLGYVPTVDDDFATMPEDEFNEMVKKYQKQKDDEEKIKQEKQLVFDRLQVLLPLGYDGDDDFAIMPEEKYQKILEKWKKRKTDAEDKIRKEKEIATLKSERLQKIAPFTEEKLGDNFVNSLGVMPDAEFQKILVDFKQKKAAAVEKAKKERENLERIEQENKDRIAQAEKDKKEKEKLEKKAAAAPDKVKLEELAKTIDSIALPAMKTDAGARVSADTKILLDKVSKYIREKIETL